MLELLLDNDVVLKYAEYRLLDQLGHYGCPSTCSNETAVLGALRFVGQKRLQRKIDQGVVPRQVLPDFISFLATVSLLEPSEDELRMSAELEEWALLNGLPLDSGESQIFAAAANRSGKVLTGDKRAIASAELAIPANSWVAGLANRVACLEQSITTISSQRGVSEIRDLICDSRSSDVALSLCFSCSSPSRDSDFEPIGLASYIESVRASAPTLLVVGNFLVLTV